MADSDAFRQALKNRLLAALPRDEMQPLREHFELISLPLGYVLYESGDRITHVHFPTTTVISLLYTMENGSTAEIGITGNNGVTGLSVLLGSETGFGRMVVQSAGSAVRLKTADARHAFSTCPFFHDLMLRYLQALLAQVSQTAVCNRLHTIEQQLCRWLLMMDDMLESREMVMTQELIANMLGVRREGVSTAAGHLQKQGLIKYARGSITILDRRGLEDSACECYEAVTEEYDRLLGKLLRQVH